MRIVYDSRVTFAELSSIKLRRMQERVLFEFARPATVIVTTPNAENNVKFVTLHAGKFRHKDHRFEWTREELPAGLQEWQDNIDTRCDFYLLALKMKP